MTHIYLIRHGQAVVNVTPIIGGMRGDTGLTPLGEEQAARLRDRLRATGEIAAEVLISSTMPRARQTAAIIAPALGLEPIEDPDVCEMNPGEADGLSFADYEQRYGKLKFDPTRPISPGGETWATFLQRVDGALTRIAADHDGKTIVVVCHGWVIEASFIHFAFTARSAVPSLDFQVTNTSITHWSNRARGGRLRWFLDRYNDSAHLLAAVRWDAASSAGVGHPAVPLSEDDTQPRPEEN